MRDGAVQAEGPTWADTTGTRVREKAGGSISPEVTVLWRGSGVTPRHQPSERDEFEDQKLVFNSSGSFLFLPASYLLVPLPSCQRWAKIQNTQEYLSIRSISFYVLFNWKSGLSNILLWWTISGSRIPTVALHHPISLFINSYSLGSYGYLWQSDENLGPLPQKKALTQKIQEPHI